MRVAVAQFTAGMNKLANLKKITKLSAEAADAGARVVVFPGQLEQRRARLVV